MAGRTIVLLHPGEMGSAVGAALVAAGHRVLWASGERSAATRARAAAAGLEDRQTLARALGDAEIVLSVCPPGGALALARAVAAAGFRGLYLDANAVASATVRAIAETVAAAGAQFVDGGIIGPPPTAPGRSRLYLAGAMSDRVATLFRTTALQPIVLDGPIGAASALKMCYAAWTKGSMALLADIRALAAQEGVAAGLLAEWEMSRPRLAADSAAITGSARKAWRWVAEMEEVAASFAAAGLPDGFHQAAAETYRRLAGFKDTAAPDLAAVIAALIPSDSGSGGASGR
jgi:3-hydroxyisobutyrate dehydrogenase-like beta-hydroxyacid dehydrogenase